MLILMFLNYTNKCVDEKMFGMTMIHQDYNGARPLKSTTSLTRKINIKSFFIDTQFFEYVVARNNKYIRFDSNNSGMGSKIDSEKPVLLKELISIFTLVNLIIILLIVFGSITLIWVVHLIWNDITVWGKDFSTIFFGSRAGENINLGIGFQVIHYYLIGISLLFLATVLLLRKSWNNKKNQTLAKCYRCARAFGTKEFVTR